MMGGRRAFVQFFSGPFLPALRAMRPAGSSTATAYPNNDGVRLAAGVGCLTFDGLRARTAGLSTDRVRDELDSALASGVVRRGLVLRCATCDDVQFQTIDRVAQRWTCNRCESGNDLSRSTWHQPPDEPTWFYDLHPVAQRLLAENGEVPALLSARLEAEFGEIKPSLTDIDEIELVQAGIKQVELDLVVYGNDILTLAECKSTNHLGKGGNEQLRRDVTKKCRAAAWLRADRLVYATTATNWQDRAQRAIEAAVREHDWSDAGNPPELLFITNLGQEATPDPPA